MGSEKVDRCGLLFISHMHSTHSTHTVYIYATNHEPADCYIKGLLEFRFYILCCNNTEGTCACNNTQGLDHRSQYADTL